MEPHVDPTYTAETTSAEGSLPVAGIFKLVLAGLVVAAVVIFVLQNLDSVPVDFLSWSFDIPLILLIVIAAAVGLVLRWVVGFVLGRRKN